MLVCDSDLLRLNDNTVWALQNVHFKFVCEFELWVYTIQCTRMSTLPLNWVNCMQYVKKIFKKNSSVVSVIFFYMGDFSMANFYTGYFFTNNFFYTCTFEYGHFSLFTNSLVLVLLCQKTSYSLGGSKIFLYSFLLTCSVCLRVIYTCAYVWFIRVPTCDLYVCLRVIYITVSTVMFSYSYDVYAVCACV